MKRLYHERIATEPVLGYFVTEDLLVGGKPGEDPSRFTVRFQKRNGDITEISLPQQFPTKDQAIEAKHKALKRLLKIRKA